VKLRPADAADLPHLQGLARSDAVRPFVSWDADELFARALDDPSQHVLVVEAAGGFAGGALLAIVNVRSRIWSIGPVMLDPAVRGKGFGVAAVRALTQRAFDAGAHRVQAEILATNPRGLKTFLNAGFTQEGVRRRAYDRDGWQDGIHVGMLVDEF
jgi:RimJ/RimL family protein N-acetyltransferase